MNWIPEFKVDPKDFAALQGRVIEASRAIAEYGVTMAEAAANLVRNLPAFLACFRHVESTDRAKALYRRRKGRRTRGGNFR